MKRGYAVLFVALLAAAARGQPGGETGWVSSFPVDKKNLGPTGTNPYFILTPGHRLHYREGKNTLTTTVLAETKWVDGVETRVVEDREERGGQLVELTRDYYAADRVTGDVYYFGEDVDQYRNGKVVGHGGAWLSGVKGARFGLMMPGRIQVGLKFYQELAPGVAMDRAELVAAGETVTTPAGTFHDCVHFRETSATEKGMSDHKWYAPGVGMVKDGALVLVKVEAAK
jgi:hypothetical protein